MDGELTLEQRDALKEVFTIGAGNAATALSQMTNKKTDIAIPELGLVGIEDAADVFGGAEKPVVSVTLKLLGDASGAILFAFKKEDALRLTEILLGEHQKIKKLSEIAQSALKEMATILSGSYLTALSVLLKMRLLVSQPALNEDMAGAIIDDVLIETNQSSDFALIMHTEFNISSEKVLAYFFFLPDSGSLEKILKKVAVA